MLNFTQIKNKKLLKEVFKDEISFEVNDSNVAIFFAEFATIYFYVAVTKNKTAYAFVGNALIQKHEGKGAFSAAKLACEIRAKMLTHNAVSFFQNHSKDYTSFEEVKSAILNS